LVNAQAVVEGVSKPVSGSESLSPQDLSRRSGYSPELDALRAIAIFSVLVSHFLPEDSVWNRLQRLGQQGPTIGVPLFFSLSGFLITRILVHSRESVDAGLVSTGRSLGVFYARRFLRIFPLYYATLFCGVIFKYANVRHALVWHLAYLSNFYYVHRGAFDRGPAPVFWTLSVEEQFYLVWPLIFMLVRISWLPALTLAMGILGAFYAGWASSRTPVFNTLMPTHLTYLAFGGYLGLRGVSPLGSVLGLRQSMRTFVIAVPLCGFAYFAAHVLLPDSAGRIELQNACRYAATAFAFAWIVARFAEGVRGPLGAVLRWSPLTLIGKISYGVYILQFFVTQMIDRAVPTVSAKIGPVAASWLLQCFFVRVTAILTVASLSFFFFERPINSLKRYFPYKS
jgi:peptidoglycan/LPS O-acetylase OafA/YrhL